MTFDPRSLLEPDHTALAVIDIQDKLVPAIHEKQRLVRNTILLLRLARVLRLPVLVTTQYRKGLGGTLPEILAEAPGAEELDKTAFSCFGSEAFRARLAALGRRQLLVCGMEAHICVLQTVMAALGDGYEVHVAADAVGSRSESNHGLGLRRMERAGAIVSSTEMAIYELLGRSDSTAFKQMLPFLKG
jgi:nicotinamidase-related amidase